MFKVPMFGFTCMGFLAVCVIIAVATFLVFRSGEQGKTKLGGCAGCAIGLALMFLTGVALCTFLAVAFLGARSEVIKRGPVESLEFTWDDDDDGERGSHRDHSSSSDADADSDWDHAEAEDRGGRDASDNEHPVHLRIEMRGGDPGQITRWLRESTDSDFSVSIRTEETLAGPRTVIDLGLPLTRDEAEDMRRDLEEALPNLHLPIGVRIEIKDTD